MAVAALMDVYRKAALERFLFAEHEERVIRRDILQRAERARIEVARRRDEELFPNGRFREVGDGHGFGNASREGHGF